MRCIEIPVEPCPPSGYTRLIETWDVLKCFNPASLTSAIMINRNMRCIEIRLCKTPVWPTMRINRNMRCIEMEVEQRPYKPCVRLIETWDVLKWLDTTKVIARCSWLIETWDVLKWRLLFWRVVCWWGINRNMRCIEMFNKHFLRLSHSLD